MSKKTLEVTIFGEQYTLVSDESKEHIDNSTRLINEVMQAIRQAGVSDEKKIAVLASLQFASKMLKMEEERESLIKEKSHLDEWVERQNKALSDFS